MRIYGNVKWFNDSKGYGFVTADDGVEFFIHYSFIRGEGYRTLKEGQRISFEKEEHDKGPWAMNIKSESLDSKSESKDIEIERPVEEKQKKEIFPVRSLKVFLCHSSKDKSIIRDLYKRLVDSGVDPWLDEEKLLPGQDWNLEIINAVNASDVVLVCVSQDSVNISGYIHKELKYALDVANEQPEGSIFIIPTKLEECAIPLSLRKWHWGNLYEKDGYNKLMLALEARAKELGLSAEPK